MLQCMNHLRSLNILTDEELADVSYYTPLRLLGLKPTDISTDVVLKTEGGQGVYASIATGESAAPSVGASKL